MFEKVGTILYDHFGIGNDLPWVDVLIDESTSQVQFALLQEIPHELAGEMYGIEGLQNLRLVLDVGKTLPQDPLAITLRSTEEGEISEGALSHSDPALTTLYYWWKYENPIVGDTETGNYIVAVVAELMQLRRRQIALDAVGNEHFDPARPLHETRMALYHGTDTLHGLITALEATLTGFTGGETTPQVAAFVQRPLTLDVPVGTSIQTMYLPDTMFANAPLNQIGDEITDGVLVSGGFNKVMIRRQDNHEPIEMVPGGPDIYATLTHNEAGPSDQKYTLSFFLRGADTPANLDDTFNGINVDILIPVSFSLFTIPFSALTTGVAFADGLPAVHNHPALESRLEALEELEILNLDPEELADVAFSGQFGDLLNCPSPVTDIDLTPHVDAEGANSVFPLGVGAFIPSTCKIYVNGSRQLRGVQFVENPTGGSVEFQGNAIPCGDDKVTADVSVMNNPD